ncbi:HAD-IA family hydrolase [Tateyamaria sp.]|uniref:HAD-IA family hydrolase n=1 Tax=Tateyamaria sp. TaxID=1929288 RepID=UPI00329ACE51
MPNCLMLDVDGVLVDGRPSDGRTWTYSLREDLGIDPSDLVEKFFLTEWKDVVTGRQELHLALTLSLSNIETNISADELISYWFEMDSRIVETVLADTRIARASGFSVYLKTNQEHARARYLMDELGLRSEVDGIVYSAMAGTQKPHLDFYAYAVKVTGRDASDHLLVDDTLGNTEGALKAGWKAEYWVDGMSLADVLGPYMSN